MEERENKVMLIVFHYSLKFYGNYIIIKNHQNKIIIDTSFRKLID